MLTPRFFSAALFAFTFSLPLAQENPPIFLDHGVAPGTSGCVDLDNKCSVWASQGECQTNAAWMMANCRRSCQSCQGGDKAWKLRTEISRHYDNASAASNYSINHVLVESLRIAHTEVNEKAQTMTIHGKLVLTWNDTRLRWDREKWGLSWLNFYWVQIWTPQVVQTNSPRENPEKISGKVLAANYTGQAFMWMDFTFVASCSFDYTSFPADRQRCCFKMDDKRYYVVRFAVTETARRAVRESALKSHSTEWEVLGAELTENKYMVNVLSDWTLDPFAVETTNCDICLEVRRNQAYYSSQILGPAVAIAVVVLSSFFLGSFWNQVLILLSALVLQFLGLILLEAKLPPASGGTPGIVKFHSFNLVMTPILLVLTVVLSNIAYFRSAIPPPYCVDRIVGLFEKIVPCLKVDADDARIHDSSGAEQEGNRIQYHWLPFAKVIKCVFFVLFLVLYIFVMIGCFAA